MPPFRSLQIKGRAAEAEPERRITVATDASVAPEGDGVALAYASSHGHYGVNGHPYPEWIGGRHRVTVCELRAVMLGLEHVFNEETRAPVRVLTDSLDALGYLRRWKAGEVDAMPEGYLTSSSRTGGTRPTLVALARKIHRNPMITFRHIQGHAQHPLNETADSLAKLALRWGARRADGAEPRELVPLWAARGHADYMARLAA